MMKRFTKMVLFTAFTAAAGLVLGCGGPEDSSSGSVTAGQEQVVSPLRSGAHRRAPSTPSAAGAGDATATPSATPAVASTDDVSATVAAAQTPDGQAIPQGAGPGGACPPVLVLLGFWSCPTLGQTCAYSAGGVTHDCSCNRTDGEGQSASWLCSP
jgi:hypothetical protein